MIILIPAIILVVALCPYALEFFGQGYRTGATSILRLMSVSGLGVMFYSLFSAVFKLLHNLIAVIVTAATNSIVIILLSLILPRTWGLTGIGVAWLVGSFTSAVVAFYFVKTSSKFRLSIN